MRNYFKNIFEFIIIQIELRCALCIPYIILLRIRRDILLNTLTNWIKVVNEEFITRLGHLHNKSFLFVGILRKRVVYKNNYFLKFNSKSSRTVYTLNTLEDCPLVYVES